MMRKLLLVSLLLVNSSVLADANLRICNLMGVDWTSCDKSLLSDNQIERINQSQAQKRLTENYRICNLMGVDWTSCDKSLLSDNQIERINESQAESSSSACAENGSCYGDINQYGVPKTIHVKGYYRKDGTYVRGHYRGKPRK